MTSAVDRFGKLARTLGLLGYPPIPIIPGTKAPRPKGWQHGEFADRGPEFADDFTGIRTRSTPAIDIDVSDAELVRQIKGILVDVLGCREIDLPARVGMAPRTLLVCRTDVPFSKRSTAAYELPTDQVVDGKRKPSKVEVLADGQQFVAYAIHPITGQSYTWLTAATPLNTWQWELVHINAAQADEFVRRCDALLDKHGKRLGGTSAPRTAVDPPGEIDLQAREDAMRYPDTPANRARLLSALKSLDPDGSRDPYMTVLRGLHSTGWADWRELAEAWANGEMHGITCEKFDQRVFNRDTKGLDNDKAKSLITVASIFTLAKAAGWVDPRQTNAKATNAAPAEGVSIQCAANIEPESISWAWLYWLALRKLAVLAGQAGTGKTTIAMSCAATVSIGGTWPDGKQCPRGSVLIWSGEDDPKDTLVPRLIAAGADLSRVHFVGNASDGIETRPFDPARDMPALQARAKSIGDISLVIVDPIVSAVSGDSHKNAEVRRGLAPLVAFAENIGAALLGISHFSKGTGGRDPLERVTGSVAFGAVARVVWVTAATESEDGERMHVLARAKSNIGPDDGGFSYSFKQVDLPSHPGITASKVEWGTPLAGRARDLLAEREEPKPGRRTETALEWLRAQLQAGPVLAKDLQEQAAAAGHAWRTVERSKAWLGVQSRRRGTGNKSPHEWHLPEVDDEDEL